MIGIGGGNGKGIPNLYRIWKQYGLPEPVITQSPDPEMTTLTLSFRPAGKSGVDRTADREKIPMSRIKRRMIIDYLTEHIEATVTDLSAYLNMSPSRVREHLRKLIRDEVVVAAEDDAGVQRYKLKS